MRDEGEDAKRKQGVVLSFGPVPFAGITRIRFDGYNLSTKRLARRPAPQRAGEM